MDNFPLISAMLFGSLEGLSDETIFLFSRTGLIHLFSASGFHLSVALGMALFLEKTILRYIPSIKISTSLSFLMSFLLMVYFGNITNWSSPMVRAFVYTSIRSAAKAIEVRENKNWVFLLSLLAASVMGKGGQLSFFLSALGMAGLIYVRPKNFITLILAPWLCTMPLVVWHFHMISLCAPIWNLLLGSAISITVMPLAIFGLIANSLGFHGKWLFSSSEWLMQQFTNFLINGDQWLGGSFWVAPIPWFSAFLFCLLAFFFYDSKKWRHGCIFSLAFIAIGFFPKPALILLDVGQGDSIYLRTKEKSLLVDFGPGNENKRAPIAFSLSEQGIGSIDDIMLTHPDLDHRGGLSSFLSRFKVNGHLWLREENIHEKGIYSVIEAAESAGIGIRFISSQQAPAGLKCWLAPYQSRNSLCPLCVASMENRKKIMLTGDISQEEEKYFLENIQPFPQVDYLKVAHHGSRYSSGIEFLLKSGAKEAFISVGRKNRYGHPSKETLESLQNAGIKTHRTDLEHSLKNYF